MNRNIEERKDWSNFTNYADRIPDKCPICGYSIEPMPVLEYECMDGEQISVICICPRQDCNILFIAQYYKNTNNYRDKYSLREYAPYSLENRVFDDIISGISSSFIKIYNESSRAEKMGLLEVSGVGYRKAIEFLVKDYCSLKYNEKIQEIRELFLSKCIKEYIDDPRIKACAERAVWIGNDETHYVRLWEDKDINDMKALIELMISWIIVEVQTQNYLETMNNGKK